MKTSLTYGFAMALAGILLALVLFFLGYHSDAEKLQSAQWVGLVGGLAIGIACLTLGIQARRAEVPAHEAFSYGRALGAGTLIALFGALFGTVFNVLYMVFINPDFREVIVEAQIRQMETRGVPSAQIEQAEGMIRAMTSPALQSVFGFVSGFATAFVLALVIAAFLKRPATQPPPTPA